MTLSPPPTRKRSSADEHRDRMTVRALVAIERALNQDGPPSAAAILEALRLEGATHCPVCCYKRKGVTGEAGRFDPDAVSRVALNPQRDGDGGGVDKREEQLTRVLRSLWEAGDHGLTDEELSRHARVFRLSAAAARSALLTAGWVRSVPRVKRRSDHGRPMTVWCLTPDAVRRMHHHGWQW